MMKTSQRVIMASLQSFVTLLNYNPKWLQVLPSKHSNEVRITREKSEKSWDFDFFRQILESIGTMNTFTYRKVGTLK